PDRGADRDGAPVPGAAAMTYSVPALPTQPPVSVTYPWMLPVAAVVVGVLIIAYRSLDRRRAAAIAAAGMRSTASARRRHGPPLLFLLGLAVLLVGLGRPLATVQVPRVAGTIVLAFDVSNSMMATDVAPSRLGAAQEA